MGTPVILYRSTDMQTCQPVGMLQKKFPLPERSLQYQSAYGYDQDFELWIQNFPPASQNTRANASVFGFTYPDSNAVLTSLSQISDIKAGVGKFKASFNIVPASWDDFISMDWTPPGWIGSPAGAVDYTARNPYPEVVNIRQHYDYFLVDPNNVVPAGAINDSGGNAIVTAAAADSLLNGNIAAKRVVSASAIPSIPKTYFCNTLVNTGVTPTPIYSSHTQDLSPAGGYEAVTAFYLETFPNVEVYKVWCANVAALIASGGNPWNGLVWDGGNGSRSATGIPVAPYLDQVQANITQFILKESVLKPMAGNIWARVTTYALAI